MVDLIEPFTQAFLAVPKLIAVLANMLFPTTRRSIAVLIVVIVFFEALCEELEAIVAYLVPVVMIYGGC